MPNNAKRRHPVSARGIRAAMLVATILSMVAFFFRYTEDAQAAPQQIGEFDLADVLMDPTRPPRGTSQPVKPSASEPIVAPPSTVQQHSSDDVVRPFGSQIFASSSNLIQAGSANPNYIIAPGDQVSVQVWGAQNYSGAQVVDPQGNIFLPEIGPVNIAGRSVASVKAAVNAAISQVFTNNVSAYVTVLSRQSVGVYVTGLVAKPGRYAGDRMASPLNFLALAGGVEPKSGSYRDIRILRGNRVLARMDLYEFLLLGRMPDVIFEENDTIVVGSQESTVVALGEVQNRYRFEVANEQATGADVIALARPEPSVSHVSVRGVRSNQPYNAYITLDEFAHSRVYRGDEYGFVTDRVTETIFVSVTGQAGGPSSFAVNRGANLGQVLKLIEVDSEMADLDAIHLRRESVAERQERALENSLNELQRAVLTAPSTTSTEAGMRVQEAQLVERFIQKARAVKPEGRVVLAGNPHRNDLRLEANDKIVIPTKSQVVIVGGEVRMPQTLMWHSGKSIEDYIGLSGGFSDRADRSNFVVIRRSGAAEVGGNITVQPGDQIMVMPTAGEKDFAIFRDIIEVLYRVAVSSAVILNVTKN